MWRDAYGCHFGSNEIGAESRIEKLKIGDGGPMIRLDGLCAAFHNEVAPRLGPYDTAVVSRWRINEWNVFFKIALIFHVRLPVSLFMYYNFS